MAGLFGSTLRWARRCAIAVIGGTVVLIGVCMLVLPGPGIVVIPAGLAILSVEFAWARIWLRKVRAGRIYAARHIERRFRRRPHAAEASPVRR